jgi:peptide chain release factor subunit 1
MLTENDLRELVDFNPTAPVLSLYLNSDPTEGNTDAHKLRARSMIKDINLPQDVEAINRYLDREYNWSGRGVAIFSCASAGFLRAFPLGVPVRSAVHISDRPSVKILTELLDNYGGYGVVLVDKQGARLFHFHLGALVEQEGMVGEAVKHTKRGAASSVPGRRGGVAGRMQAVDEQIDRNMKDAADFAVHFFESKHIRRIIIGGTDENVKQFRSFLPKAWQSLVMGSITVSLTANHTEVQTRAIEVGLQAELVKETRLIDTLITETAKAGAAVTGLVGTLEAINQGRVQLLIITEGLRKVGYKAKENGHLAVKPPAGEADEFEKFFDVIDLAVNAVMRSGGEVEVIHQSEALEKVGCIGALLRY